MNSFALVLASVCLVQTAFCRIIEPSWGGCASEIIAPAPCLGSAFNGPLIEGPFGGYAGAYGLAGPYGAGFYGAGPFSGPFAGPFVEGIGAYGGEGIGDVAVAGEMGVAGTTLVTGQVPILGAVRFAGDLPAGGVVTIAGSCGCGCGRTLF